MRGRLSGTLLRLPRCAGSAKAAWSRLRAIRYNGPSSPPGAREYSDAITGPLPRIARRAVSLLLLAYGYDASGEIGRGGPSIWAGMVTLVTSSHVPWMVTGSRGRRTLPSMDFR